MADNKPSSIVIILDFGAQYTQLIARRVRECSVYCEILPYDTPIAEVMARSPKGIIFSGGPSSVYEDGAPRCDTAIYDCGVPILGICYGAQLMAYQLGGKVTPGGDQKEFGRTEMRVADCNGLFKGLGNDLICWMSHGDKVEVAPQGFAITASTDSTPVAAMENHERKLFGVQFHPEVVHTPWGSELLRNFLINECGLKGDWTAASFIDTAIEEIRKEVGSARVVCGVSGGVDSSVVAALVHKAIGEQLTCIFVNHGLLRLNEAEQVRDMLAHLNINLIYVDAEERFLKKLAGVTDPERKRKIIGEEFVRVFEEHAEKLRGADYLAQGTLYPDVIESGGKNAAVIKSHHNVGGLPDDMNLKVLEPVRWLFKDEVRAVGIELGLPEDMVWRHPFPGPGLAIRVLGEVSKPRLDTLRLADAVVIEEIKRAGLYKDVWQALAVLAPIKSVGVMGDERTYADTIIVRAVTSEDAMTADWAKLPYEVLERISNRIINEISGVNRVAYDISSKPPATVEWE